MKKCRQCNNTVDEQTAFCPNCGSQNFEPTAFDFGQSFYTQTQTYQPPADLYPQRVVKGTRWWNILIAVLVLVAIAVITYLAVFFALSGLFGDANDFENESGGVAYTQGTFVGGVYTNEWANIRLEMPADYTEADPQAYASFENDYTDCAFYAVSPENEMYTIVFEDVGYSSYIDEEKYLDLVIEGMKASVTDDMQYGFPSEYETVQIAGEEYYVAHMKCSYYGTDLGYQSYYARKIDDKMCGIIILEESPEVNNALACQIEAIE